MVLQTVGCLGGTIEHLHLQVVSTAHLGNVGKFEIQVLPQVIIRSDRFSLQICRTIKKSSGIIRTQRLEVVEMAGQKPHLINIHRIISAQGTFLLHNGLGVGHVEREGVEGTYFGGDGSQEKQRKQQDKKLSHAVIVFFID